MNQYRQNYTPERVNKRREAAMAYLAVLIMAMAIFVPFYLWSM